MLEPKLHLQKPLEDYVEFLEVLSPRTLPLLSELALTSLSFNDPYLNANGVDESSRLLLHRLNSCRNAKYKVGDFVWGRRPLTAYIYWEFSFYNKTALLTKKRETKSIIPGMSEIVFSQDGLLHSCSEFWGAHEDFHTRNYQKSFPRE